jgi:hypothetical protein
VGTKACGGDFLMNELTSINFEKIITLVMIELWIAAMLVVVVKCIFELYCAYWHDVPIKNYILIILINILILGGIFSIPYVFRFLEGILDAIII